MIPCNDDMLYEPMSRAISLPEPNWEQPRPEGWTRGGDWGSQRTILFSGMKSVPCSHALATDIPLLLVHITAAGNDVKQPTS